MIDNNILKFGYGDIAVGSSPAQLIRFQQFKPPEECGNYVSNNVEFIGKEIIISLTYEDYRNLKDKLKEVKSRNISLFEFKGYIFNFTNYNEKSVEVCEKHMEDAMKWYFICYAA